jgi:hypothetical protein
MIGAITMIVWTLQSGRIGLADSRPQKGGE